MKDQLSIAVEIAVPAHADQKYGNKPYVIHLMEVDRLVLQMYANVKSPYEPYSKEPGDEMDTLRAIAFLHDVIEDTDVTQRDLANAGISDTVIHAVVAMSKCGEKYNDYIDRVKSNPLALKVKLCDTAANLSNSIKEGNMNRINKYTKQIQLLGGFQ